MIKRIFIFSLLCLFFSGFETAAQETFPVNGVHDKHYVYHAFINATIFTDYKTKVDNGTLLIQNELIINAGSGITLPPGTVIHDLKGKYLYPSLIDLYSSYGLPAKKKQKRETRTDGPQIERKTKGAFAWNEAVRAEYNASQEFIADAKTAEELRKTGFGAVLSHNKDGIARGSGVFVSLGDGKENELIIKDKAAAHYSFRKGSSTQDYPSSLMGSIALLRQTFLDAQWYSSVTRTGSPVYETNLSLAAFNGLQLLPQVFEADDKFDVLRADKAGDEFGVQYIIKTGTAGYQRINEIKQTGASFIISINFPKPYDVEDPYDALNVSLEDMKHWESAPSNPAKFEQQGIEFSITLSDLKDKEDFWKNLRTAIKYGLSEETALKSLTYTPAKMLGVEEMTGSLKKGMIANFIIASGNLFEEKNIIYENWIAGKPYKIKDMDMPDIRGKYVLGIDSMTYELNIKGQPNKPDAEIVFNDTAKFKIEISIERKQIALYFNLSKVKAAIKDSHKGVIRLQGNIEENNWKGKGQLPDGSWVEWSALRKSAFEEKENKKDDEPEMSLPGDLLYPNMAYGWKEKPKQETVLIKNATVWTNEKEGVLEKTDVLIQNGKIVKTGKNIESKEAKIIDASGKHLTSGIIDEHSHIAISKGVNEGAQPISAEVRIGDVINSDDINIYRQLSGGVTAAQLLHGSANPIGGQSGIIKLRWGSAPEDMKIKGADGFIKFALGENVKQSNWGNNYNVRFPQTRMGVEQVYYDAFIRAKEYIEKHNRYDKLSAKDKINTVPPRKDLELEALSEILNTKRFISCHSYRQSEINMLMHVADSIGIKINTFTHILEGYKVADKMKAHGAGGSTFSDWWAYKWEVEEATPYNGAIMHSQGITVAYNSDNAEMGRRLNQEAAKAVKYGGVAQQEALKFVTLNPAKLLHLDDRMGSIKAGKDADIVLWSGNPLSIYSKVEKTFVDGICYYDAGENGKMKGEIEKERARLITKMILAKKSGEKTQKPEMNKKEQYRCEP